MGYDVDLAVLSFPADTRAQHERLFTRQSHSAGDRPALGLNNVGIDPKIALAPVGEVSVDPVALVEKALRGEVTGSRARPSDFKMAGQVEQTALDGRRRQGLKTRGQAPNIEGYRQTRIPGFGGQGRTANELYVFGADQLSDKSASENLPIVPLNVNLAPLEPDALFVESPSAHPR